MKIDIGSCSLNIERSGNANGPTVLMAHSLGCNLHMWDPQMKYLESDFDVVRLDMRGHGLSDTPDGPYTLDQLADDVIAVMDYLNLQQVHWVGLSIGGMIGQSLLLRYSDRFLSAALCDTASSQPDGAASIWKERIHKVETEGLGAIKQATLERWFTAPFLASNVEAIEAIGKQIDQATDIGYVGCCHAIAALNYHAQLPTITTRVLLIVGAEDIATPVSGSEAMHQQLSNSALVVIDDAAHIANVEQVDAFNAALFPFLREVSGLDSA